MPVPPKIHSPEDIQKLSDCYIGKKMSTTDIAKQSTEIFGFSVSTAVVYNTLLKNDIPLRTKAESVSMARYAFDTNSSYINEEMTEWIDGFLLGDGGIKFDKKHSLKTMAYNSCSFYMGSKYEEWVNYGMSKFNCYSLKSAAPYGTIDEKHPNKLWYSKTLGHTDIQRQAERWYPFPNCTKKVPSDVRITPTSVLLWYLGDGTIINNQNVSLATCSFSIEDINTILIPKLERQGIHCSTRYWKQYPYIFVRRNSVGKFFDFIGHKSPIACYDYKFNFQEWYSLQRISDIANDKQEVWKAQWYCKNNMVDFTRSPGDKFFLFNDVQARQLRLKLDNSRSNDICENTL